MALTLARRGPDAEGVWGWTERGVFLGHRRLSILDLSSNGNQPMHSASGRFTTVYNGEIYNFAQIGQELGLESCNDTAILLAAFERWGVDAIARFVGMFAFALVDRKEARMYLVRDRFGIKPLYYGWHQGTFLFGSELRALEAHPDFQFRLNREALGSYLVHNYFPGSQTVFENTHKLPPGHWLVLDLTRGPEQPLQPRCYWSPLERASACRGSRFELSEEEVLERLEALLQESVRLRMISDVPVGAFLSGGIDSSLVVSMMQRLTSHPVRTFTIGFQEAGYNEAEHAKKIARYLGTEHTEEYLTRASVVAQIPEAVAVCDEPFADSSLLPSLLVSRLARQQVTVCLTGDGGDELFAGYRNYQTTLSLWKWLAPLPYPLRRAFSWVLSGLSFSLTAGPFLGPRAGVWSARLSKLSSLVESRSCWEVFCRLTRHIQNPTSLVLGARARPALPLEPSFDALSSMMLQDASEYLPDDILTKVDRATMHYSLEGRVPLLDHRVADFAWSLPNEYRVREGKGKWVLRQMLSRLLPAELVGSRKKGFSIPLDEWLRGPLREWTESLLEPTALARDGYLNSGPVRKLWRDHLEGRCSRPHLLWSLLMFQAWLRARPERAALIASR